MTQRVAARSHRRGTGRADRPRPVRLGGGAVRSARQVEDLPSGEPGPQGDAAGACAAPLRGQRLTEDALARALTRAVRDAGTVERARVLGGRVRAEGGAHAAVRLLEQVAGRRGTA
ncbi:hypothetical protein [Nocardiopsis quinghaiensis]|uniref:hypothetical protein n=1 Tax=Nocardiopsis quinghaiensis TaxID=464995 RepID=UPI00123C7044|nr:hypothetical protein [Nocardiopsis quinghaiensis]